MILDLTKKEWKGFFADLTKRHFLWETKIEVINEFTGKQILSEGLPLNGITAEIKGKQSILEISVGGDIAHQTHIIEDPSEINFFYFQKDSETILEIDEKNGTATLLHFYQPVPDSNRFAAPGASAKLFKPAI